MAKPGSRGDTAKKTAATLVINVFKKNAAYSPDTAIPVEKFKNVKLSTDIIGYTIGNLISENIVIATDDNRYYYSHENYRKLEKKVGRVYWILIAIPVAAIGIILVAKYYNQITAFFTGLMK